MTINTQKLRDGPYLRDGKETTRIMNGAADALDAQSAEIAAQARHANFLNAEIARLRFRIAELRVAVRGLLDAMPSATTHPAIQAAKAALKETCHD